MRAKRVDANQKPLIRDLRSIYGPYCAFDLSGVGKGIPDQLLAIQGHTILMEIKTENGKLTPAQVNFHRNWNGGPLVIAHSIEDVVAELRKLNARTFVPTSRL